MMAAFLHVRSMMQGKFEKSLTRLTMLYKVAFSLNLMENFLVGGMIVHGGLIMKRRTFHLKFVFG